MISSRSQEMHTQQGSHNDNHDSLNITHYIVPRLISLARVRPEHPPHNIKLRNLYPKPVRSSNLPLTLSPRSFLCSGISLTVRLVDRLVHPNFFRNGAVSSSSSSKKQAEYC